MSLLTISHDYKCHDGGTLRFALAMEAAAPKYEGYSGQRGPGGQRPERDCFATLAMTKKLLPYAFKDEAVHRVDGEVGDAAVYKAHGTVVVQEHNGGVFYHHIVQLLVKGKAGTIVYGAHGGFKKLVVFGTFKVGVVGAAGGKVFAVEQA